MQPGLFEPDGYGGVPGHGDVHTLRVDTVFILFKMTFFLSFVLPFG